MARRACTVQEGAKSVWCAAMQSNLELAIVLPPFGSRAMRRELHRQLRAAIVEGRLQAGFRLPASRELAKQLGIARNTVVSIYDMLLSEGYLETRPGAGTFVATSLPAAGSTKRSSANEADARLSSYWRSASSTASAEIPTPEFDLRLGMPDKARFPFEIWRRLSNRALRRLGRAPARYMEPQGSLSLREAITGHVSFARAVACNVDSIVVTAGAQQAFDLLARILVTPGKTTVAIEDPGYPPLRHAFAAAGARIAPIPVDHDGLIVDRLPQETAVVCVTPSHQFPLGVAMSRARRLALLDFAQRNRAVIIEDDYDGEFRFGGRPVDALQTLDRTGSVFYVGTFSKSLFPALRLGYVVTPDWARAALLAAKQLTDWHGPALPQETLAAFIAEGHLARHVRRMRGIYDERRTLLLEALARHMPGFEIIPAIAGLHMSLRLPGGMDAEQVVMSAARLGIGIDSLGRYAVDEDNSFNGLALGYGSIDALQIEPAIRSLAQVCRQLARRQAGQA